MDSREDDRWPPASLLDRLVARNDLMTFGAPAVPVALTCATGSSLVALIQQVGTKPSLIPLLIVMLLPALWLTFWMAREAHARARPVASARWLNAVRAVVGDRVMAEILDHVRGLGTEHVVTRRGVIDEFWGRRMRTWKATWRAKGVRHHGPISRDRRARAEGETRDHSTSWYSASGDESVQPDRERQVASRPAPLSVRAMLDHYDFELPLRDALNDPELDPARRALAALAIGTRLDLGHLAAAELADAVQRLASDRRAGVSDTAGEGAGQIRRIISGGGDDYQRGLWHTVSRLTPDTAAGHLAWLAGVMRGRESMFHAIRTSRAMMPLLPRGGHDENSARLRDD